MSSPHPALSAAATLSQRIPRYTLAEAIRHAAEEWGVDASEVGFDRAKVGSIYRPVLFWNGHSHQLRQFADGRYSMEER